jgi:hypothetical protein
MLRIGDIIEVRIMQLDGVYVHEVWRLATIIELEPTLRVEFLKTKELLALPPCSYGTHWR